MPDDRPESPRPRGKTVSEVLADAAALEQHFAESRASDRPVDRPESPEERIARAFHEEYERLAPALGYETRPESAVPWEQVPPQNATLMMCVVHNLLARGVLVLDPTSDQTLTAEQASRLAALSTPAGPSPEWCATCEGDGMVSKPEGNVTCPECNGTRRILSPGSRRHADDIGYTVPCSYCAPSPREEAATPRLHVICADCEGWDATNVSCPHGCGVALKAPFVATPGDDATTKEGR